MTTTKILVTGAAGNIGGALVHALIKQGDYEVTGVDNFLTGSETKLPPRTTSNFSFFEADVNNFEALSAIMRAQKFDVVFHYAAVVGVQRTLSNPILVLNDIDGIRNILQLSKETGVGRVFYSSSSEVYGEPVEFPQNEMTTPLNSRLPYAIVKNVGEAFLRSFHKQYGVNYTIFRFFNTYGPFQSEDFVISRFIRQAVTGKDITIYGNGAQTRTFCFIDDNIDVTLACLQQKLMVNDVMNLGSDEECRIGDLARMILRITQSTSKIVFLPPLKDGDMARRQPDNSKMKNILNRPLISLEEGIRRTIQGMKY